ncbi:MAG: KR domain-containing protein [Caldilineaceae bacterium]
MDWLQAQVTTGADSRPLHGVVNLWPLNHADWMDAIGTENPLEPATLEQLQQSTVENRSQTTANISNLLPCACARPVGSHPEHTACTSRHGAYSQRSGAGLGCGVWAVWRRWNIQNIGAVSSTWMRASRNKQPPISYRKFCRGGANPGCLSPGAASSGAVGPGPIPSGTNGSQFGTGPAHQTIRTDATYLITGGLGAIGLAVAQWLAAEGAGALVLTGRSGIQTAGQQTVVDAMIARAPCATATVDVADGAAMRELFAQLAQAENRSRAFSTRLGCWMTPFCSTKVGRVLPR